MEPGESTEALDRVLDPVQRRAALGDTLLHRTLEDRREEFVLAPEVEIDRSGRDPGRARDVGHLGAEESFLGKDLGRGTEDGLTLVSGRTMSTCTRVSRGSYYGHWFGSL